MAGGGRRAGVAPRRLSAGQLGGARRGSSFRAPEPRHVHRRIAAVPGTACPLRRRAPADAKVRVVLGRVRVSPRRSVPRHRLWASRRSETAEACSAGTDRRIPRDLSRGRTARVRARARARVRAEPAQAVRRATGGRERRPGAGRSRHRSMVGVAREAWRYARPRPHARRRAEEVIRRIGRGGDPYHPRAGGDRHDAEPSACGRG